ncbi:hypothetical protein CHS0354_021167 [Potamilus streckersoni]|uniref:Ig-like domain-containing protein n=1 Tax=Potamilus streckersoni TaxID=2493646 RepID=A0AAE0S2U7_9BIVA|nr:hypothetical protein CHS0354_021167 [Potamilus streckersoni]
MWIIDVTASQYTSHKLCTAMEFRLCVLLFVCLSTVFGELKVSNNGQDHVTLGQEAHIDCSYDGSVSWYVLRWKRKFSPTGEFITFLNSPSNSLSTDWAENIDISFKDRVRPSIRQAGQGVVFTIIIYKFRCDDAGTYVCEVVTSKGDVQNVTVLDVTAPPETPRLPQDVLEVKEGMQFRLFCHANVGLPSAKLRWSYKMPNSDMYTLLENDPPQQDALLPNDCRYKTEKIVQLTMSKDLNGAIFRCFVATRPDMFDESLVSFPGYSNKPTTTEDPCIETNCKPHELKDDPNRGENKSPCSVLLISIFVLSYICR